MRKMKNYPRRAKIEELYFNAEKYDVEGQGGMPNVAKIAKKIGLSQQHTRTYVVDLNMFARLLGIQFKSKPRAGDKDMARRSEVERLYTHPVEENVAFRNGKPNCQKIANRIGVSRARVRQIVIDLGLRR